MQLKQTAIGYTRTIEALFRHQHMQGFAVKRVKRAARHLSFGLRLADPTELEKSINLRDQIALSSNTEFVMAFRKAGLLTYQFQLHEKYWETYTLADLPSTNVVGLGEGRSPVEFNFDNSPHALIAGTTGSGKTEAIKSILVGLMTTFEPRELKMVVCDANRMLTDFENCVHLNIPISYEISDMKDSLLYCQQQLQVRKSKNERNSYRLCLVIDEATETLLDKSDLQIVKTLVKQGRAFKINVILGTQSPSQKELPGIVDQLLNRFVGQVSNASMSTLLTGHADLQAHKLTGKGDFIHIEDGEDTRFQVALATKDDYHKLQRGQINTPTNIDDRIVEFPDIKVGRPKLQVSMKKLAYYFYHGPDNISLQQAEIMGIKRTDHNLHKANCEDFINEFRRIRNEHTKSNT